MACGCNLLASLYIQNTQEFQSKSKTAWWCSCWLINQVKNKKIIVSFEQMIEKIISALDLLAPYDCTILLLWHWLGRKRVVGAPGLEHNMIYLEMPATITYSIWAATNQSWYRILLTSIHIYQNLSSRRQVMLVDHFFNPGIIKNSIDEPYLNMSMENNIHLCSTSPHVSYHMQ